MFDDYLPADQYRALVNAAAAADLRRHTYQEDVHELRQCRVCAEPYAVTHADQRRASALGEAVPTTCRRCRPTRRRARQLGLTR